MHSPYNGEESIEYGNGQDNYRYKKGNQGRAFGRTDYGQTSQHKSKEVGTGITHEGFGGIEVKRKKSGDGCHQGEGHQSHLGLAFDQSDNAHSGSGNSRYACGQAVQPVNQVNGIAYSHYPEQGKGYAQGTQVESPIKGVGDKMHYYPEMYRYGGGSYLTQKFDPGG